MISQYGRGSSISSGRHAGQVIGGDVADAVAAGLDRVHLHARQIGQDVRHLLELRPVVLDVLPGGEMAVAAVIAPGDVRQHAQLPCVSGRRGSRPAASARALDIQAVAQPQRRGIRPRSSSPARKRRVWSRNCATRSLTSVRSMSSYWYTPPSLRLLERKPQPMSGPICGICAARLSAGGLQAAGHAADARLQRLEQPRFCRPLSRQRSSRSTCIRFIRIYVRVTQRNTALQGPIGVEQRPALFDLQHELAAALVLGPQLRRCSGAGPLAPGGRSRRRCSRSSRAEHGLDVIDQVSERTASRDSSVAAASMPRSTAHGLEPRPRHTSPAACVATATRRKPSRMPARHRPRGRDARRIQVAADLHALDDIDRRNGAKVVIEARARRAPVRATGAALWSAAIAAHSASALPSRTATPRRTARVARASMFKARSSVRMAFGRSP